MSPSAPIATRTSSPAASASGSRSRERSSVSAACCSPTSRPARSTPSTAKRSCACCGPRRSAVRRGDYPVGRGQVAVTDGVAELMRLELGSTLALDGRRRTVVGIVENPRKLGDEFALVSPTSAGPPEHVTVLLDASAEAVTSFIRQSRAESSAFTGSEERPNDRATDTLATFSVATVFLLLASLIAAAGFAVVAQRRLRQLGMLAAIGATQKQLRLALLANGAIVRPTARRARTLRATAAAEARTSRSDRRRRADRSRRRLARALGPGQSA